jgi:glyoxylase-like metal-dependent hydrolase (beta-lactamase superfamily II)
MELHHPLLQSGAFEETAMARRSRHAASCLVFSLLCCSWAFAGEWFDFKPMADGVYAAIAKPTFRANCNSIIVVLDNGVLVVDTESKPSAAQEVIDFIKSVTNKPVKYLVITHFHADHTQGAEAYLQEWPGAEIISSEATRTSIVQRGTARLKHESGAVPGQIAQLRSDLGNANDKERKEALEKNLREAEAYLIESKKIRIAVPTITVERSLILQHGRRTVKVLWLGKAHTDGDLFVFLPEEKILLTGDSLQSLTPTMRDSYPAEWVHTLDEAEKLDFDTVLGGHGDVIRGKATFELWKKYFTDLLQDASQSYASGASLDETRKQIIPVLLAKYGREFPPRFSETIVSNVEKAYRVASGATE